MPVELATGVVQLIPSARGMGAAVSREVSSELSGPVESAGKNAGGALKGALLAGGGLAAAAGIKNALGGALDAARESNKVTAQTEQVIRSTGGAANLTAGDFSDLAGAISRKTGVDDEAIQTSENLLATFTNIHNEVGKGNNVFDQATQAVVDMSAVQGDLQGNSILVGKALQDPVAGVSALQRVGVKLTDQQKDQVKAMVAVRDVAGAQKIIIKELGTEFGGQAAAQATASDKMRVSMGNLQEKIGAGLVPVVDALSTGLNIGLDLFERAPGPVQALVPILAGLALAIGAVIAVEKIYEVVQASSAVATAAHTVAVGAASAATAVWSGIQAAFNLVMSANPIVLVALAIAGLVAGVIIAYQKVGWFRDLVDGAFHAIQAVVKFAVDWIKNNWPLLLAILLGPVGVAINVWRHFGDDIKRFIGDAKDFVVGKFNDIVSFVTGLPGRIASVAKGMWNGISDAFKTAINFIIRGWNSLEFKVPGFSVGPVHFGGFTLGVPDIKPLHAGGTTTSPGLVNMKPGEELVFLPQAATVAPMAKLPGGGFNPTINVRGGDRPRETARSTVEAFRRLAFRATGEWVG